MNDVSIEIIYERYELERFRQDILTMGETGLFLPVCFIEADGKIGATYDSDGYDRLTAIKDKSAGLLLGCVRSIMEKSERAESSCFFSGEYSVDPRYIFIERGTGEAALIYRKVVPATKGELLDRLKKILLLYNGPGMPGSLKEGIAVLSEKSRSFYAIEKKIRELERAAKGQDPYR